MWRSVAGTLSETARHVCFTFQHNVAPTALCLTSLNETEASMFQNLVQTQYMECGRDLKSKSQLMLW